MTYPPAPWNMHGQLWLSLFRVREGDHPDREPGVYGAALVSYEQPSPLTYSELLVARPVKAAGGRRVNITDIWVDSADSRDGGRDALGDPEGPVRLPAPDHRRPGAANVVERQPGRRTDRLGTVHRRLQERPAHTLQGLHLAAAPSRRAGRGPGGRGRAEGQRQGAAVPGLLGVQRVGAACLAGRQATPRVVPDVLTFSFPSADLGLQVLTTETVGLDGRTARRLVATTSSWSVVVGRAGPGGPCGRVADLEDLGREPTHGPGDVTHGGGDDRRHASRRRDSPRSRRPGARPCGSRPCSAGRSWVLSACPQSLRALRGLQSGGQRSAAARSPCSGASDLPPGRAIRQIFFATLNSCLCSGPVL